MTKHNQHVLDWYFWCFYQEYNSKRGCGLYGR